MPKHNFTLVVVSWLLNGFCSCVFVCPQEGKLLTISSRLYTRHQTALQGVLAVVILLCLPPKGVLIAPLCRCCGISFHLRGQNHATWMGCFPFWQGAEWRCCEVILQRCDTHVVELFFSDLGKEEKHFARLKARFQQSHEECCNDSKPAHVKADGT